MRCFFFLVSITNCFIVSYNVLYKTIYYNKSIFLYSVSDEMTCDCAWWVGLMRFISTAALNYRIVYYFYNKYQHLFFVH